jgi:hypothetical protein
MRPDMFHRRLCLHFPSFFLLLEGKKGRKMKGVKKENGCVFKCMCHQMRSLYVSSKECVFKCMCLQMNVSSYPFSSVSSSFVPCFFSPSFVGIGGVLGDVFFFFSPLPFSLSSFFLQGLVESVEQRRISEEEVCKCVYVCVWSQ